MHRIGGLLIGLVSICLDLQLMHYRVVDREHQLVLYELYQSVFCPLQKRAIYLPSRREHRRF